jgi:hypothetical protein
MIEEQELTTDKTSLSEEEIISHVKENLYYYINDNNNDNNNNSIEAMETQNENLLIYLNEVVDSLSSNQNGLQKDLNNLIKLIETNNNTLPALETFVEAYLKGFVPTNILDKCNHEFIFDSIDIDPDRSKQICYCIKCDETKVI